MSTSQNKIDNIILNKLGKDFDSTKKYIIAIQGASSSGKSTLARQLHKTLSSCKITTFLFSLDSYYKPFDNSLEEIYDFDNPDAYDWIEIYKLINSLLLNEKIINIKQKDKYVNDKQDLVVIKNPCPQVIIIEGIYSFNCVNENIFNLQEFDVFDTNKSINNAFSKRIVSLEANILKFYMPMCKNKLKSIRISRDLKLGRSEHKIKERFDKIIWPNTIKWVYSSLERSDIQIVHGNFNVRGIFEFSKSLTRFFCGSEIIFSKLYIEENFIKEFEVYCSKECLSNNNSSIILEEK